MYRTRAALLASICLLGGLGANAQTPPDAQASQPAPDAAPKPPPPRVRPHPRRAAHAAAAAARAGQVGDPIQNIRINGNQRIEDGTILSYMLVQPGDAFGSDRVDKSLRTLYATGLFADVSLHRDGNSLVVQVKENPLVNQINFEGNHNIKEDDLKKALTLRSRAVFTPRMAQQDRQKLLGVYAGHGRFAATVSPEIVRLPQNRVNVVFKIVEGPETEISRIIFIGNHAFSENTLKAVIESREERWWRFLSSSDQFNPERVNFDRELVRRFYLEHGYADVQVTNTVAELSPDRKAFFLTFQVIEGERYRVGKISVRSSVPKVPAEPYRHLVAQNEGAYYNGSLVERTVNIIESKVRLTGDPFLVVNPRIARNAGSRTVDLDFDIVNGKKSWVERIDISGNTYTRDKVVRREFRFAEGDPNDPTLVRITKQRLTDLGYFTDVKLTPTPGSAPDRVIMDTSVTEKATGELSLGGGYSTTAGVLGQAALREHNLVGSGIDGGLSGTIGTYESQVDISATDPYFLDRNLVFGGDIFYLNNNNYYVSDYSEERIGLTARLGYAFNDHVSQAWNYTISDRDVNNLSVYASDFVRDEEGWTLLSQLGQTITFDWRDSRLNPHSGFIVRLGTDLAGLGGSEHYLRSKIDTTYFLPLDWLTGNSSWGFSFAQGAGYLENFQSRELIIDRFFLGGDNLRGFLDQGAGPHSVAYSTCVNSQGANVATPATPHGCVPAAGQSYPTSLYRGADPLGGNFIWTQSTEFHFPLPVPADFGLAGRAFMDTGALSGLSAPVDAINACLATTQGGSVNGVTIPGIDGANLPRTHGKILDIHGDQIGHTVNGASFGKCYYDTGAARMSVGLGFSWKSPFGLINIDFGIPIMKEPYDQTQVFKFGFGTRFQ